jgi:hypothetical protein
MPAGYLYPCEPLCVLNLPIDRLNSELLNTVEYCPNNSDSYLLVLNCKGLQTICCVILSLQVDYNRSVDAFFQVTK